AEDRIGLLAADHHPGQRDILIGLRLGIDDDRLDLATADAARLVDLLAGELDGMRLRRAELGPDSGQVVEESALERAGVGGPYAPDTAQGPDPGDRGRCRRRPEKRLAGDDAGRCSAG